MSDAPGGPLEGVSVVDLTSMLAGPYCTMLLADMGADVIKVESQRGDGTRLAGPFREDDELQAFGGYFQSVNRNKRSVVLDLKSAEGADALRELVKHCDILVENYSPGVMDRLGMSYESLRERNPALVYGSIRGFGDPRTGESPHNDWLAYDVVAQAMGGFMGITGTADGLPLKSGPGLGDIFPATHCALGVVAALYHAQQTGQGQYVDVAMYDSVLSLCERIVYQHSYTGAVPGPQGSGHPLLCPFDIFETSDGHLTIAAPGDHHWQLLCESMGRPDLAEDERLATNRKRVAHAEEVRKAISEWTTKLTGDQIMERLGGRVAAGPVNTVEDIFNDPHARVRRMLERVEQPGSSEPVTIAGHPIKFTETPAGVRHRAPLLGEHTAEVLHEHGIDAASIPTAQQPPDQR